MADCVNFAKAYDSVNHQMPSAILVHIIGDYGGFIISLFLTLTTTILNSVVKGRTFRFKNGIPQGGVLSTLLFNLIMLPLFYLLRFLDITFTLDGAVIEPPHLLC